MLVTYMPYIFTDDIPGAMRPSCQSFLWLATSSNVISSSNAGPMPRCYLRFTCVQVDREAMICQGYFGKKTCLNRNIIAKLLTVWMVG